jgi:RNA polymerase sigma-70 factor (ECF subfamily)
LLYEEQSNPSPEIQQPTILPIDMDAAELDELFASCMPRLRRTARQMLRNPQDCEDVMQEGLLRAFRKLSQFEGRSSFFSWLHSILRNSARTHVRRMKCRPKCSLEEELSSGSTFEQHFVDPGPSPEERCARQEQSRVLREVLPELPSRYRLAMQLCDVEGLESKDASRILGMSSGALKTSLFRARRLATQRIRGRVRLLGANAQERESTASRRNQSISPNQQKLPLAI